MQIRLVKIQRTNGITGFSFLATSINWKGNTPFSGLIPRTHLYQSLHLSATDEIHKIRIETVERHGLTESRKRHTNNGEGKRGKLKVKTERARPKKGMGFPPKRPKAKQQKPHRS